MRIICFREELICRSPWTDPEVPPTPRLKLPCKVIAIDMQRKSKIPTGMKKNKIEDNWWIGKPWNKRNKAENAIQPEDDEEDQQF